MQADIARFVARVHNGEILGCNGRPFQNALVVGIGGSSLGPVFVSEALRTAADKMRLFFIDNTDPDGMDMVLQQLEPQLAQTMVIVISKSGGTVETQNGLVEVKAFFAERGLRYCARRGQMAGQLPDVGLGGRPHLGAFRGGASAVGLAGH